MKFTSLDARNTANSASSCGVASRPAGTSRFSRCLKAGSACTSGGGEAFSVLSLLLAGLALRRRRA